ncbi:MAG: DUF58 domain-containing protein [Bacteroidota bacterium]|nr:DUF58 domain-containing protein [Bacteroidota bacterium]
MKNLNDINELSQLKSLNFLAKHVAEGFITGLHKSPYHGFSVEFAEHRAYNAGESTKNIDWKLFGRTDKLFVKRFEEETNLRCRIIIDVSSSMHFPYKEDKLQSKLDFSLISAAAIIHLLRKQRDASGVSLFSEQIELHTEAKMSSRHMNFLLAELSEQLNQKKPPLNQKTETPDILHYLSEKIHKRSLVIIFSDMFVSGNNQALFSALQHMRHNKHEVILFHVTDHRHEKQFQYGNRPYKFVDMETGETLKLNPNQVREQFEKQSDAFYKELKLKAGHNKIDFISADINSDFKEVLLPYLIKRSKLY